jgi:phage terminase large subunit
VYARQVPPVGPGECWVSIARSLQARWGIEAFYCDPSEPANIAAFSRDGLPAAAGDNSVEPGIARVAALLSAGRLFVAPTCRNLIDEFARYAYETDADGNPTGRVLKAFDHALDALRYAVVGLQSRPTPRAFLQTL